MALAGGSGVQAQNPQAVAASRGCPNDVPVSATRELISFDSGRRSIRAYLYTPLGAANGTGVVMLHGSTGFEINAGLFDIHASQLASRGYRVIMPAYFDAASPDRGWPIVARRLWRRATLDAAAELAARSGVEADQIAMWGYSLGASIAAETVTNPESTIRAAVLAAGGGEIESNADGRDLSVLLLHARRDEAVPVRSTQRLAESLRGAGATAELQELAFDGHQYDLATWCDAFDRTRRFLESRRAAAPASEAANRRPAA